MMKKLTAEQLKAAYALNLCTVSISQIIEYNDIHIMEQEYESILNNLNLEQMPTDEALLDILKQVLDTITFFRIQEGDKEFIEKDYQQKMKNAIWSAAPNIGLIVAGGNPLTMVASLASQVGIGYMNYRRAKADGQFDKERQLWQLERTAIEQFNGLRRELFDTAWRLSSQYEFPDQLRLTERQIKQYNNILMDTDLLRKYERLNTIKDEFLAYPPFWYHFGNTANAIARSELPLSDNKREKYKKEAKDAFFQYRESNQQGLLREDQVSAACALELIDLLDFHSDQYMIRGLLADAIRFSGRRNDVLQLAAITYLKLNDQDNAATILRQLVNEEYNTTLNAQLLSSIYVNQYLHTSSEDVLDNYEILRLRVGDDYLYPLPDQLPADGEMLEKRFLDTQKQVLFSKYQLVMREFRKKYWIRYGKIIPLADESEMKLGDQYFLGVEAILLRKIMLKKIFDDESRVDYYISSLRNAAIPFRIIDLLNDMFDACCDLSFMGDAVRERLAESIETAILEHQEFFNSIQSRLSNGRFSYDNMCSLLDLSFPKLTDPFFETLKRDILIYIESRTELQDFSLAEQDLQEFCEKEELPDPGILYGKDGNDSEGNVYLPSRRFNYYLLGNNAVQESREITNALKMTDIIKSAIPRILDPAHNTEFFTREDPRLERYFNRNPRLKNNPELMAKVLAVLDDQSKKDQDLLFTSYGVIPVRMGVVRKTVSYGSVTWISGANKELMIEKRFNNPDIDMDEFYSLIQKLQGLEKQIPNIAEEGSAIFDMNIPEILLNGLLNPFGKK